MKCRDKELLLFESNLKKPLSKGVWTQAMAECVDSMFKCTEADIQKAIKEGRYAESRRDAKTGACLSKEERIPVTLGKVDFVFVLDNSGSMGSAGSSHGAEISKAAMKKISPKLRRTEGLDGRIVIMSHNPDKPPYVPGPVVLDAKDPKINDKIEQAVNAVYAQEGDGDEQPLEALEKYLPSLVRSDANVIIEVITDEADSSSGTYDHYAKALKNLTKGSLTFFATDITLPDLPKAVSGESKAAVDKSLLLSAVGYETGGGSIALSEGAVSETTDQQIDDAYKVVPLPGDYTVDDLPHLMITVGGAIVPPARYSIDLGRHKIRFSTPLTPEESKNISLVYSKAAEQKNTVYVEEEKLREFAYAHRVPCRTLKDVLEKTPFEKWSKNLQEQCAWVIPETLIKDPSLQRAYQVAFFKWANEVSKNSNIADDEKKSINEALVAGKLPFSESFLKSLSSEQILALLEQKGLEELSLESLMEILPKLAQGFGKKPTSPKNAPKADDKKEAELKKHLSYWLDKAIQAADLVNLPIHPDNCKSVRTDAQDTQKELQDYLDSGANGVDGKSLEKLKSAIDSLFLRFQMKCVIGDEK